MTITQVKEHNAKINNKIDELNEKRNALVNDTTISDDDFFAAHDEITKEIDSLLSQLKSSNDITEDENNIKEIKKDIFSSLKVAMHKVTNTNQYYYFIGMLTMAKTTETITKEQYNYLLDEANAKRTIKQ